MLSRDFRLPTPLQASRREAAAKFLWLLWFCPVFSHALSAVKRRDDETPASRSKWNGTRKQFKFEIKWRKLSCMPPEVTWTWEKGKTWKRGNHLSFEWVPCVICSTTQQNAFKRRIRDFVSKSNRSMTCYHPSTPASGAYPVLWCIEQVNLRF